MKRCQMYFVTLCGLAVLFTASVNAAVPQTINYQGRLTDAAGDPVPNVPILVKFTIWDAAAAGAMLWNSGFQSVTPEDGLFTYPLGSMVNLPDNLFTDTIRYLGITIGADPELVPRERFRTVPYAYHALRADTADISATVFDGAITGPKLAANSVIGGKIVDGTITASDLGTNSVAADEIQPNAVGNSEMLDNAIGSPEVIDNSLTAADLAAGSVGTSEVADNTLTENDLAANSVGNSEMRNNAIGSAEVIDNSLTAFDLAPNSVGLQEMQSSSVGSFEVIDNSLTANDLAAGSVGASELATGSVVGGVGGDILDNTITSADIQNSTITGADIANSSITGTDIANGSISDLDLGDEPGVAQNVGTAFVTSTSITSMISRSITVPTNGFILAIASCEASVFHSAGTTTFGTFGVSEFPTSRTNDQDKEIRIPSNVLTGTYDHVIMAQKIFGVPSGVRTIHFVANKSSVSPNWTLNDLTLSLIFFSTSYGTVTETPPSPPGTVDGDLPSQ